MNGIPFFNKKGESVYLTNATVLTCLAEEFKHFMKQQGVDNVYFVGKQQTNEGGMWPFFHHYVTASERSLRASGGLDCREKHSSGHVFGPDHRLHFGDSCQAFYN